MNKQTKGILLALAGAVALFWWWRRRQTPEAKSDSALANIGQLGGDFQQDVTPEIVKATLDYADKQSARNSCFFFDHSDHTSWHFINNLGQKDVRPAFTYPPNYCGNAIAG